MNTTKRMLFVLTACSTLLAGGAIAQQFVYPAKGQKPEQQKKDEAECSAWAAQQVPPQSAPPPTTATVLRDPQDVP